LVLLAVPFFVNGLTDLRVIAKAVAIAEHARFRII
jgi:hypothetical protein